MCKVGFENSPDKNLLISNDINAVHVPIFYHLMLKVHNYSDHLSQKDKRLFYQKAFALI